jgi:hypothetical protein
VFENDGVRPFDLDVLSDEQPILGSIGNDQQAQAQDRAVRSPWDAGSENVDGLGSTI